MVKNKKLLHSFHHFLIGCLLILKGFDKFSHHNIIGTLILIFGIIILGYFIYSMVRKRENKNLGLIVHIFEAMVGVFTTYIFFKEGKVYLPYLSLLATIGFSIAVYVSWVKLKKEVS